MRSIRLSRFVILSCLSSLAYVPAIGAEPAAEVRKSADPLQSPTENSIDSLLDELRRQREPDQASRVANRVMANWNDSGSATVNLLLKWADDASGEKRNAAALDFLDQAIVLAPQSIAPWNRRATLHYTMGQYRKSMSDINRVLALEPRHFGALAGMAAILGESGRDAMALEAWERYLAIYPADRQAQDVVSKLSEKLAGSRT